MYAVIRAGGKQYRVAPGDVIKIETSAAENGKVTFDGANVLAVSTEAGKIGKPNGDGASVTGQVVSEGRGSKILVFKFKRKKQYKKMIGHRQNFHAVRITSISADGQTYDADGSHKPSKRAAKRQSFLDAAVQAAGTAVGVVAGVADVVSGKSSAAGKGSAKKPAAKKKAAPKKAAAKKSTKKK